MEDVCGASELFYEKKCNYHCYYYLFVLVNVPTRFWEFYKCRDFKW